MTQASLGYRWSGRLRGMTLSGLRPEETSRSPIVAAYKVGKRDNDRRARICPAFPVGVVACRLCAGLWDLSHLGVCASALSDVRPTVCAMRPQKAALAGAAEGIQTSFRAEFAALDGYDRMTRRWQALATAPDLYGPSPAVRSALVSLDLGHQTMTKSLIPSLTGLQSALASVTEITSHGSAFQSAMRSVSVPQVGPVLRKSSATPAGIESLRAGPLQQLVQQSQTHQRILKTQIGSVQLLFAERLLATPSDFGFDALSRQLSAQVAKDRLSFGRAVSLGMQGWLNDFTRQSTLLNDALAKAAKSTTLPYEQQQKWAATSRLAHQALAEAMAPFGGNATWIGSLQEVAERAAATRSEFDDLLQSYPEGFDVVDADDWVVPGSPGTPEYPLLTAARFQVISREALAATPYVAFITICALIPHLGPAVKWAEAKLDEYDLELFLLSIAIWISAQIRAAQKRASEDD